MSDAGHAARLAAFFENFSRADLARLQDVYAPQARFKDPFHEVRGLPAIEAVYRRMFDALEEPVFVITQATAQGYDCWLAWDMRFRFKSGQRGELQVIRGASHLRLAADGRIASHRDYWDAAEELYEKMPVLGALMRWLKRRVAG